MSDTTHQRAKAVRLRAEGWQYKQIAEMLDVGRSTVYRWVNPDAVAGYERKRRKTKREWHHRNYHGVCRICGGETGQRTTGRCRTCLLRTQREHHETRLDAVEKMYNAGAFIHDIAVAVGQKPSPGALGRELKELRAAGRIGYRIDEEHRERMRQARWGAVA